jgi:WD40 repeat protein
VSDVFISYARAHQAFVKRLHDALALRLKAGWVDWEGIPAGADWMAEIEEAIDAADVFVFVITTDALRSEVCARELARAVERNKRLVPLLCEDLPVRDIPAPLRARQLLMFRPDDEFESSLGRLVAAIDRDLVHAKDHTRLQLRAARWESLGRDASLLLRETELERAEHWLAAGGDKEPVPTALHGEFIHASRTAQAQGYKVDADRLARARRNSYALQLSRVASLPDTASAEAKRLLDHPSQAPLDLRDFCWGHLHRRLLGRDRVLYGGPGEPTAATMSDDGAWVAAAFADEGLGLWRVDDGSFSRLAGHTGPAAQMLFSPDASSLAVIDHAGMARVLCLPHGHVLMERAVGPFDKAALAFLPRQRLRLAAASGTEVRVVDLPGQSAWRVERSSPVASLALTRGGQRLVVAYQDGRVQSMRGDRPEVVDSIEVEEPPSAVAMSDRGGSLVLAFPTTGRIELRQGRRPTRVQTLHEDPQARVGALCFNAAGEVLVFVWSFAWPDSRLLTLAPGVTSRVATLYGHATAPRKACLSGDGRCLATWGADGLVVAHAPQQMAHVQSLTPESGHVVAWSASGRWMAVALPAGGVEIVDITTGGRRRWEDATLRADSLSFAPDDSALAAHAAGVLGFGAKVWLWEVQTGQVRPLRDGDTHALAWSPDSCRLAMGAHAAVAIWNRCEDTTVTVRGDRGPVRAVAFSPDGKLLASGDWRSNEIWLSDPDSGEVRARLKGHSANVIGLGFLDGGRQLVSVSEKDAVLERANSYKQKQFPEMIFWDLESMRETARVDIEEEVGVATALAVSPDGALVALGHRQGQLSLWDPVIAQARLVIPAHRAPVSTLDFAGDARTLVSSAAQAGDGLKLWRADDWHSSACLKGHKAEVYATAFTPDSQWLLSASGYDGGEVMQPGEILRWDPKTAQCRRLFSEHDNTVRHLAMSPDAKTVAALADRGVIVIDVASGDIRWRAGAHGRWRAAPQGTQLAYSTDGSHLFVADRWLDAETGVPVEAVASTQASMPPGATAHAVSPDGQWVAVGWPDGRLQFWPVSMGEEEADMLDAHRGRINALAFSADGRLLASAGGDSHSGSCTPGEAILWDVKQRSPIRTLYGHVDAVRTVAISPDGQFLVSGGRGQLGSLRFGDLRLWHLPSLRAGNAAAR